MTNQEKIEILNKMLNKNGLSINDQVVIDFLESKKQLSPLNDNEIDFYSYSSLIKPTTFTVLPSHIENVTYAKDFNLDSIMAWYLYKNSSDNPLVFNNLESDYKRLKEGFEKAKERHDFLKMSPNGKLFNEGDGNHRLLTLKIKHFVERTSAKSQQEKMLVDEKYKMNLKVSMPISKELSDLLSEEKTKISSYSRERKYSKQACIYREDAFAKAKENEYFCDYNHKTKTFKFSLNGKNFEGTDAQLCAFLKSREYTENQLPIMTYVCDGTYHISCYNMVWKTKDLNKAKALLPKIRDSYLEKKYIERDFLQIMDCDLEQDKNAYSIKFPDVFIGQEKSSQAKNVALNLKKALNSDKSKILGDELLQKLKHECEEANFWGQINIYDLKFDNISKEQFKELSVLFNDFSNIINAEKENDLTKK